MNITLRTKLILLVLTATVTVLLVIVVSAVLGTEQGRRLDDMQNRIVPKLELGPKLETELEHMRQGLQDAVAAQESSSLDTASQARTRMFELLASAGPALTPAEAALVRWNVNEYYQEGRDVARRLLAGETGERIVDDMARLQGVYAKAALQVKSIARLKPNELAASFDTVRQARARAARLRLWIGFGGLLAMVGLSYWSSRAILNGLSSLSRGFARFATGNFSEPIPILIEDEIGLLARDANKMAGSLEQLGGERDRTDWLSAGQAGLSDALRGELEPVVVARRALGYLAARVEACAGALYLADDDGELVLAAQYALTLDGTTADSAARLTQRFPAGQGLLGEAATRDAPFVVSDPPAGYLKISSGLGEATPKSLVFLPLQSRESPVGVLELALFSSASPQMLELLTAVRQSLGIALQAASSFRKQRSLLERTQEQATLLSAQEEELRLNNQELQEQQQELRAANEELEAQRAQLSLQNVELEQARVHLQQKAEEVSRVSSYKSQFLANMSHELRTPLNSMLLLSHLLSENDAGNLSAKQVEHAKTIHSAGQDLLGLINQVLDLAKIESGKQELQLEETDLSQLAAHCRRVFQALADEKGLALVIEVAPGAPKSILSDRQRIERVLTNLLGNAIKFTERGTVTLRIGRPDRAARFTRAELSAESSVALVVSDTGVGIPEDARERVFQPFEQLEARTTRRYAGTGLGLAIARETVSLLGGELQLESELERGSTFSCYLPERSLAARGQRPMSAGIGRELRARPIADDRQQLSASEPHLLIVEDDPVLAEQLLEMIHARQFKVVVANSGAEGLQLARELLPRGIVLDVRLPDLDGWTVMERLRDDPVTRAIPVHFLSGVEAVERGLSLGAIGYLTKPATHDELAAVVRSLTPSTDKRAQRVLIVEDDASGGELLLELVRREGLEGLHVASATAAVDALANDTFGCMILDLGLPDMDGLGLLETLRNRADLQPPRVVVHTGRALTKKETRQLEAYSQAVILKDEHSVARLVEQIRLFVHHLRQNLPQQRREGALATRSLEVSLDGTKILLAEDDMRTVYALSALLRGKGAEVLVAENGREALQLLQQHPDVHGVLMDIMMPEMDGYEAMRRLRTESRFAELPVLALTAKAMKGERERCLEAGASGYLTKPIDSEKLLAAIEPWRPHGSPE